MKAWAVSTHLRVKPAAFLDRDGTLTYDRAGVYITKPGGLKLYSRSAQALRLLADKGYRLIVLTNQSGVARGYFTLSAAKKINVRLRVMLARKGVKIHAVYFCPHGPREGCSCRKPRSGLVKEVLKDFSTRLGDSIMIGDKASDMGLAINAGIRPMFVTTGHGAGQLKKHAAALKGIPVFRDIFSAACSAPDRSKLVKTGS
jgi:D-glycero-D-manno-heptose 1,7-bisphosphate phosphatase